MIIHLTRRVKIDQALRLDSGRYHDRSPSPLQALARFYSVNTPGLVNYRAVTIHALPGKSDSVPQFQVGYSASGTLRVSFLDRRQKIESNLSTAATEMIVSASDRRTRKN